MRHADHDLLHAERAAALDDLLQRRDHRLAAIEAEALGAGKLQVAEFLEAFGFGELVEDGALALAGEADLLVATLDALLHPGLLRWIGDVHELDAERLAIGAAQDREHLADGREFEAEHLVEEDRAVEIGLGEAVGSRIELRFGLLGLKPERIEVRMEVAADAVGADQHQRADRISRRLLYVGRRDLGALGLSLAPDLVAERFLDRTPVAGQRGQEFAVGADQTAAAARTDLRRSSRHRNGRP